jgi:hypothetical protein
MGGLCLCLPQCTVSCVENVLRLHLYLRPVYSSSPNLKMTSETKICIHRNAPAPLKKNKQNETKKQRSKVIVICFVLFLKPNTSRTFPSFKQFPVADAPPATGLLCY